MIYSTNLRALGMLCWRILSLIIFFYGLRVSATQTTETTHNFHTKNITSDGEPIPTSIKSSKKGGIEAQREQLQKQELNVVAVVIPVVLAFFLVCMRLTIVFYITG
ncbi:uncharacterized protein LOC111323954 [Stylophora pistillata]|uniref:uncharacterized protein LOC111323954 n=1 Tax=Stylophora pistillata TaxID=50429 RepID=UPI000C04E1FD|nr:uncharacterized protein LOC111323954 [Stylophora pistillata]